MLIKTAQFSLFMYLVALVSSMGGMEIFSTLLFIIWLLYSFKEYWESKKLPIQWPPFLTTLLVFWGVIALGATLNPQINQSQLGEILGSQRWIIVFLILTSVISHQIFKFNTLIKILVVCSIIVSVYSIVQAFTGVDLFRATNYKSSSLGGSIIWRAKGFFSNPITYANTLSMFYCFLFGYFILNKNETNKKWIILNWVSFVLLSVSLVLSFTRGAWVGIVITLVLQAYLLSFKKAVKVAIIIASIFALGFLLSPVFKDRFESSLKVSEKPVGQRFELWQSHWTMFKDNPIFGIGYEMSMERIEEYHLKTHGRKSMIGHAHNNFLQILANTGITGFLVYLALIFQIYFYLFKNRDKLKGPLYLGLFGAFTCFHLAGLTESSFIDGEVSHMHGFFLAVLASDILRSRK